MAIRAYTVQTQAAYRQVGNVFAKSVSQSLGVTDEVKINTTIRAYTVQTQVVYKDTAGLKQVSNDLDLSQFATFQVQPSGINHVSHDLGLDQDVHVFGYENVEQELGVSDVAAFDIPQIYKTVTQYWGITDVASQGLKVNAIDVEQDLGITDAVRLAKDFAVSHSLNLSDVASFTDVFQDLGFTDVAEWGYGFDAEHDLDLSDSVEVDKDLNQTLSHGPFLGQAASYFVESRCGRYQFQSFHGEGGVEPTEQRLNYASSFLVQSLDDGTIVELRNPETDDRRRYAFNRVNRDYFDGTADIFADDAWVTEQTQIYTIVALKRTKLEELFTFLLNNLGREVLIKDWKGVTWKSIITNPGEIYTEDSEGRWTIDFEVNGEEVDGEYVVEPLGVDQTVSRAGSIWTRDASNDTGLADEATQVADRPETVSDAWGLTDDASYSIV